MILGNYVYVTGWRVVAEGSQRRCKTHFVITLVATVAFYLHGRYPLVCEHLERTSQAVIKCKVKCIKLKCYRKPESEHVHLQASMSANNQTNYKEVFCGAPYASWLLSSLCNF